MFLRSPLLPTCEVQLPSAFNSVRGAHVPVAVEEMLGLYVRLQWFSTLGLQIDPGVFYFPRVRRMCSQNPFNPL
jgi:hypothetical protein